MSAQGPAESSNYHRAFRVDNAVMRWRAKRARQSGYHATVIPYTGYGSTSWIRVLGRVLYSRDPRSGLVREEPSGSRGWRSFVSVPVESAEVTVLVNDDEYVVHADPSGIIDVRVEVSMSPGWHTIRLSSEDSPWVRTRIHVVDPEARLGIVSDIDDTVMVTSLPRPMLAAWHTFVVNEHARTTTPGMPVLYERLTTAYRQAPVVYLSTGAWNVAPTLTRFLSRNLYPAGALLLTDWGPTADRWFRSGRAHKRASLARLAEEFPDLQWLLFGDDGQHDEALYAEFATEHPDNVRAVCIRQLTPGEAVLAGSGARRTPGDHGGTGVPWLYAADGAGLAVALERAGVLPRELRQPEVQG